MASLNGFKSYIAGATGSQGVLGPEASWKVYVLPRGAYASQASTGAIITFDSAGSAARLPQSYWVQVGLDTSKIRQVSAVGGNSINVGTAVSVAQNDRIFLIGTTQPTVTGGSASYQPHTTIYARDDSGGTPITNSMVTTDSNGAFEFYPSVDGKYDLLVQDSNRTLQTYIPNASVGVVNGEIRHVADFPSGTSTDGIQEAINDLPASGGIVQLSAGTTYVIDVAIDINKSNVHLRGMGPSTVIVPSPTFEAAQGGRTDGLIVNRTANLSRIWITDMTLNGLWSTQARATENMIQLDRVDDVLIDHVIAMDGNYFGISIAGSRVIITNCIVKDFLDSVNGNGISIGGLNAAGNGNIEDQAIVSNNVVERIGTIGIDVFQMTKVAIVGNIVRACTNGIEYEADTATTGGAAELIGGEIQHGTIANNVIVGSTTELDTSADTMNGTGIAFWLRDTWNDGDTADFHHAFSVTGNVISNYRGGMAGFGGHWRFADNIVYNYAMNATNASSVGSGEFNGIAQIASDISIENNHFFQGTGYRATSGFGAAIAITGNTGTPVQPISRVRIRGNFIDGQDLTASSGTQYGIFITSVGSDYDISDNYFRETAHSPIRIFTNAEGLSPSNWRVANNYMVNCNAESGGAAAAWFSFADGNSSVWSNIAIVGNIAFDANSRMTHLFANSGSSWSGALRVHNNIAPNVTTGLLSLVSSSDLASASGNIPEGAITQAISAAGNTLSVVSNRLNLTVAAGGITLTSTPTISNGYDGQRVRIINVDSADTVYLLDQGFLAGTNVILASGATFVAIGPTDTLDLEFNSTIGDWIETSRSNN